MTEGAHLVRIVVVAPDGDAPARDAINVIGSVAWLALGEAPEAMAGDANRTVAIAATNAFGDHKVLFHATRSDAEGKRARVEAELRSMPFSDWCERYRLTPAWCRGQPIERPFQVEEERSARRRTATICLVAAAFTGYVWWRAIVPEGWAPAAGIGAVLLGVIVLSYFLIVRATIQDQFERPR